MKNLTKNFLLTALISLLVSGSSIIIYDSFFGGNSLFGQNIQNIQSAESIESEPSVDKRTEKNTYSVAGLQQDIVSMIAKTAPSVVNIIITKDMQFYRQDRGGFFRRSTPTQVGGGSGIVFSREGLIVTNKHVVQDFDADYTVILYDGTELAVDKVWLDPVLDLAVIRIAPDAILTLNTQGKELLPATFLPSTEYVSLGQFALAIGNALAEYQNSVTLGIISGKNRKLDSIMSQDLYMGLYQTDTSINQGNSGGPLVDIFGRVIGINTAISAQANGIGFALPVNQDFMDATVQVIKTYGRIVRPFLGVEYIDLTVRVAEELGLSEIQGSLVQGVVANTPAQEAGLLSGDIIQEINGVSLKSDIPFLYAVYMFVPGDVLELTVDRGGEILKKNLTLTQNVNQ